MNCLSDCSVYQILNFCSRKSRAHLSQFFSLNFVVTSNFSQIDIENVRPAINVRRWYVYFLIKPTGSYCSWVKGVLMICGTNHEYIVIGLEPVHFCQHLVNCASAGAVFITVAARF